MELYYKSTRNSDLKVSASKAILTGLAPDGGLFVPERIPALALSMEELAAMDYQETACAVIIEPIQGESGVNPLDKQFVRDLEAFCKARDILLIVDEVQTGNGRTGKLYAYEHYGISPDIVTTAKGLAGGLPIGACLFFSKTEHALGAGDHGSTFGGNPVSCAGAVNILSRITDELLLEVQGKGEYLRTKLKSLPGVKRVTGMGLMLGVETERNAKEVAKKCLEKGLLVLTAHDKVRLLPPLTVTKGEMDEGLNILSEVLKA